VARPPAHGRLPRPGERGASVWGALAGLPPGARSASAGLLHIPPAAPLTCSVTAQRAMIAAFAPGSVARFRRGGAVRFGPDSRDVSARDGAAFPPRAPRCFSPGAPPGSARVAAAFPAGGCRDVSARDATGFPAGVPQVSGRTASAAARPLSGCRAAPVGFSPVCRLVPGVPACPRGVGFSPGRRLVPGAPASPQCVGFFPGARFFPGAGFSRTCGPFPAGRARRNGSGRHARPANQPLTSGPARVRLIRRMTRRSRSIAAR